MSLKEMTLATVCDGKAEKAFAEARAQVEDDIADRIHEVGTRKITLTIEFTPDAKRDGYINQTAYAKVTLPPHKYGATAKIDDKGMRQIIDDQQDLPLEAPLLDALGGEHGITNIQTAKDKKAADGK